MKAPYLFAVLVASIATIVFNYGHEWAHALGFWMDGLKPCVGLNNTWVAPPLQDVKTFTSGLLGPLFNLVLGFLFLAIHLYIGRFRNCTFLFSIVNFVAHPFAVVLFVPLFIVTGIPNLFPSDEGSVALMLPATRIDTSLINQIVAGLDRGFLFQRWSVVILWPFVLLPLLGAFILVWKGRPVGHRRAWGYFAVVLAVIYVTLQAIILPMSNHFWIIGPDACRNL